MAKQQASIMEMLKSIQDEIESLSQGLNRLDRSVIAREGEFGDTSNKGKPDPKPPDHTWRPTHNKAETWVPFDFDNETFDYQRFEFSGSRNPRDYLEWEKDMDAYFRYYSVPREERLSYSLRQIIGKAHQWWIKEEEDRWWYQEPTINTWGQLKWIMREKYAPNSLPQANHTQKDLSCSYTSPKLLQLGTEPKVILQEANEVNNKSKTSSLEPRNTIDLEPSKQIVLDLQVNCNQQKVQVTTTPLLVLHDSTCSNASLMHLSCSKDVEKWLGTKEEHKTKEEGSTTLNLLSDHKETQRDPNNFLPNPIIQKQWKGVIASLLIKEQQLDAHHQAIHSKTPNLKTIHESYLPYVFAGKLVLRTKLKQEGEYDEVIKSRSIHGAEILIQVAEKKCSNFWIETIEDPRDTIDDKPMNLLSVQLLDKKYNATEESFLLKQAHDYQYQTWPNIIRSQRAWTIHDAPRRSTGWTQDECTLKQSILRLDNEGIINGSFWTYPRQRIETLAHREGSKIGSMLINTSRYKGDKTFHNWPRSHLLLNLQQLVYLNLRKGVIHLPIQEYKDPSTSYYPFYGQELKSQQLAHSKGLICIIFNLI